MTLQEALQGMREAAGQNAYVSIDMSASMNRFSAVPVIEWTAWRSDTLRCYSGDTFEQAAKKAIEDKR